MGKVKNFRRKHIQAVKPSKQNDLGLQDGDSNKQKTTPEQTRGFDYEMSLSVPKNEPIFPTGPTENMFKDIEISSAILGKQTLVETPNWDARSSVTSKSLKNLHLKKKDKMVLRKKIWLEKVGALEVAKKEMKAKKKRAKNVIVGDMKPLEDTLPTLELLLKTTNTNILDKELRNKAKTKKGIETEKKKKSQMISDINLFKQVINHPTFKTDPKKSITEHLRAKIDQEDDMDQ